MGEPTEQFRKFASVCCLGFNQIGLSMATVIAQSCPTTNVTVIDFEPEKIILWNTNQTPCRDTQTEEILKEIKNRNLIFSEDRDHFLSTEDIILLTLDVPICQQECKKPPHVGYIMDVLKSIAKNAESKKIIVLKSIVPIGMHKVYRQFLHMIRPDVNLQLLLVPDFLNEDTLIKSFSKPEKVLIGSDLSKEAMAASEVIEALYNCWVPLDKIKSVKYTVVELAKVTESAFLAQKQTNANAMLLICEQAGGDVQNLRMLLGSLVLEVGLGGTSLKKNVGHLVEFCKELGLPDLTDYWRQVLLANDLFERYLLREILSSFFNDLRHKKFAVWGLSLTADVEALNYALAVDFLKALTEEGATLHLWDPRMEIKEVLSELKRAGVDDGQVTFFEEPTRAACKVDAILVLMYWRELDALNYTNICKEMTSPAHIFDRRLFLPYEKLVKAGFVTHTGRETKFRYIYF